MRDFLAKIRTITPFGCKSHPILNSGFDKYGNLKFFSWQKQTEFS
jgi:hypothetical protein